MRRAPVPDGPPMPPERLWRLPTWLVGQVWGPAHTAISTALGGRTGKDDYAILATLAEFGPMSQASLGRRLDIDESDMVALLHKLCTAGLTRRVRDENDRRRNITSLTPKGKRALEQWDEPAERAQDVLLAPLSEGERRQFTEMLARLVSHHRHLKRSAGSSDGERAERRPRPA